MLHSPPGYDDAMMAGNSEEPSRGQHANEVLRDAEKATPDSKVEMVSEETGSTNKALLEDYKQGQAWRKCATKECTRPVWPGLDKRGDPYTFCSKSCRDGTKRSANAEEETRDYIDSKFAVLERSIALQIEEVIQACYEGTNRCPPCKGGLMTTKNEKNSTRVALPL